MDKLLKEYWLAKKEEEKAKKKTKELNEKIKKELKEQDLDVLDSEEYTVTKTEVNRDEVDDEKLLSLLLSKYPKEVTDKVIKYVKVVDYSELENLCYNRIIDTDDVNACIVHKPPVIRLNIKERKE